MLLSSTHSCHRPYICGDLCLLPSRSPHFILPSPFLLHFLFRPSLPFLSALFLPLTLQTACGDLCHFSPPIHLPFPLPFPPPLPPPFHQTVCGQLYPFSPVLHVPFSHPLPLPYSFSPPLSFLFPLPLTSSLPLPFSPAPYLPLTLPFFSPP